MVWTKFWNVGKMPTDKEYTEILFVELPQEEAVLVFELVLGFAPRDRYDGMGRLVGRTFVTTGKVVEEQVVAYYRMVSYYVYDRRRIRFIGWDEAEPMIVRPPPKRSRVVTLLEEEPA